jgi:hypothetical protein
MANGEADRFALRPRLNPQTSAMGLQLRQFSSESMCDWCKTTHGLCTQQRYADEI